MLSPTLRHRIGAAVVAVLLASAGLAGCSVATTATSTPSAASATSSTSAGSSTTLSAGSWTGTIGDQSVTVNGAYVVDGIDATIDGGTYASATADQAVFLVVNGGHLTISNATVTKAGTPANAEADAYNFYGLNSAVVVVGSGSTVIVSKSSITTDAGGANAVFATAQGTADVSGVTITTSQDSSRGLDATYEGVITAKNMTIATQGAHCAALATDRGNGTVTVTGTNNFTTKGDGSPLVYSTGDISVTGLTGSAAISEVVVIEGKNTATITDSKVTSGGKHAAMLYQSMSGDAADADATASGSTLALTDTTVTFTGTGAVVYATNTTTTATLTNVTAKTSGSVGLKAAADRWGNAGSNGAKLTVKLDGTTLVGASADDVSSITVTTTNSGQLTGTTSGKVNRA